MRGGAGRGGFSPPPRTPMKVIPKAPCRSRKSRQGAAPSAEMGRLGQTERKRTELRGEADKLAARGAFSGALCLTSKADKNPWRFTCGHLQEWPKDLGHYEQSAGAQRTGQGTWVLWHRRLLSTILSATAQNAPAPIFCLPRLNKTCPNPSKWRESLGFAGVARPPGPAVFHNADASSGINCHPRRPASLRRADGSSARSSHERGATDPCPDPAASPSAAARPAASSRRWSGHRRGPARCR